MKRFYCILILYTIIILTGCTKAFYYNHDELKDTIEKVDVLEYVYVDGVFDNIVFMKTLNDEEVNQVLTNLPKIKFIYPFGDPYELYGICIKIVYKNHEYEIISRLTTKRYKNDIEIAWYRRECSKEDWNNMIFKIYQ